MSVLAMSTAIVLILWLSLVLAFDPDGLVAARARRSRNGSGPKD
jgi:hypothetical protein